MLKLIEANEKYLGEYKEAYLLSMEKINEGIIKRHDLMFVNPDENDVIQIFKDSRDKTKLKPTYVPSYDYFAVDDDKFVGIIHIRISLTPALLNYGGHIGYSVNPKYWRQGYGTQILKLGLEKAKELIKDDRLLITCDDDNIGSQKIIEANGGILENKFENEDCGEHFLTRRYWIQNE
jgi:predicted acetyltransferase